MVPCSRYTSIHDCSGDYLPDVAVSTGGLYFAGNFLASGTLCTIYCYIYQLCRPFFTAISQVSTMLFSMYTFGRVDKIENMLTLFGMVKFFVQ